MNSHTAAELLNLTERIGKNNSNEQKDFKSRLLKAKAEKAEFEMEVAKDIMNTISDPAIETIVIMSSAQVGKPEIINNN